MPASFACCPSALPRTPPRRRPARPWRSSCCRMHATISNGAGATCVKATSPPACRRRQSRCAMRWRRCARTGRTCARTPIPFWPVSRRCCPCTRWPRPLPRPCRNCRSNTKKWSRSCCRAAPRPTRWWWPSVSYCWPNASSARSIPCWPVMTPRPRPPTPSAAMPGALARCSRACSAATRPSR
ncbi:hypothetical protein D3C76_684990 [compost metagenome]